MNHIIAPSFIIGAIAAFIILAGRKSGIFDYLQALTPPWMPWECDFCLSFWLSLLITILAITTATLPPAWPLIPVLAAVISKALVR